MVPVMFLNNRDACGISYFDFFSYTLCLSWETFVKKKESEMGYEPARIQFKLKSEVEG